VAVEIEDDGQASSDVVPGDPDRRPGTGLTGLRERAAHLGGGLEAGPLASGGFRLRVAVPMAVGEVAP
jgi:signal transduction histidine kinase